MVAENAQKRSTSRENGEASKNVTPGVNQYAPKGSNDHRAEITGEKESGRLERPRAAVASHREGESRRQDISGNSGVFSASGEKGTQE